jgi:hypothetical protein
LELVNIIEGKRINRNWTDLFFYSVELLLHSEGSHPKFSIIQAWDLTLDKNHHPRRNLYPVFSTGQFWSSILKNSVAAESVKRKK